MSFKHIVLGLALAGLTGPALAASCPKDMKAVDAALKTASLSEADMAKVKKLRAEGEELHNSGKHKESVEALHEALEILGVKEQQ